MCGDQVLLLMVIMFFTTAGAIPATAETNQTKLFSTHYPISADESTSLGRSLRLAMASSKNDNPVEHNSSNEEDRVNSASALLSKVSEKIPIRLKLEWWQTLGKSNDYVKKKLGLANLKGSTLANHVNFRYYLKYADNVEVAKLWRKADTTTFSFWKEMGLADKIKTVDDLKNFRHTNEFRKYKRFVNIVDENMLRNVLSWGNPDYVISPSYYNHASATHVEKWARAEIWGESKRTNEYVKDMLGLIRANEEKISKNEYYQHYLSTFAVTLVEPAKSADIDALRKILLTS